MYTYRLDSGLQTYTERQVPLREPCIKNILKIPNEKRKVENYNYLLTENPIDVKIINKRLVKLLDVPQPY